MILEHEIRKIANLWASELRHNETGIRTAFAEGFKSALRIRLSENKLGCEACGSMTLVCPKCNGTERIDLVNEVGDCTSEHCKYCFHGYILLESLQSDFIQLARESGSIQEIKKAIENLDKITR